MSASGEKIILSRKKKILFSLIALALSIILVAAILYISSVVHRGYKLYQYLKTNQRGWSGRVHAYHPELGYAPIPGAKGGHIFPIGPDLPMRYDENGFRVPVKDTDDSPKKRPLVLALGGSFTYGDATPAEDTFSYLVGQELGGSTLNAGVCGYGLLEMLILAKKLIPAYKPDYVLVQYSSWLVKRARNPFAPIYFGMLPVSYLFEKNGGLEIHPPVFPTIIFDLPIEKYRHSDQSAFDFISFLFSVGFPLLLHDDFYMTLYRNKTKLGLIPSPSNNYHKIGRSIYRQIAQIAEDNGAEMVIVVLGWKRQKVNLHKNIWRTGTIIARAQSALLEHSSKEDKRNFAKKYFHWRGSPPVVVDTHPNACAHKIIAEEIVKKIKEAETGD